MDLISKGTKLNTYNEYYIEMILKLHPQLENDLIKYNQCVEEYNRILDNFKIAVLEYELTELKNKHKK